MSQAPPSPSPGRDNDLRPANNLLRRLVRNDYDLLAPRLQQARRNAGDLFYNPGDDVEMVVFPCGPSLLSYQVINEDGRDLEAVMVGREGAVGGLVSLGRLPAYCRIMVKYPGAFVQMPVGALNDAKEKSRSLRFLLARYTDCLLAQIFQSTACNAIHSIEQRTAKWILAAMERTGDHVVPVTHDQLAGMLGVGRSYASRVLLNLRAEGLLETQRGAVTVRDLEGLKARSCLCNEAVKNHFEVVLRGLYPAADT
jgi:CRP-like cAMP-binding protein